MKLRREVKYLAMPVLVSLLLVGCGASTSSESQLEALVGDWNSFLNILSINADGTYVSDVPNRDAGEARDETGTIAFDGTTLTLTTGEVSRGCEVGDQWVFELERFDDEQFRGVVTVDDCHDTVGQHWTWTRCDMQTLGEDLKICTPVK